MLVTYLFFALADNLLSLVNLDDVTWTPYHAVAVEGA